MRHKYRASLIGLLVPMMFATACGSAVTSDQSGQTTADSPTTAANQTAATNQTTATESNSTTSGPSTPQTSKPAPSTNSTVTSTQQQDAETTMNELVNSVNQLH